MVRNLSADGVHVEVQAELPPRTEVVVALDLPMGEPVLLSGATQPTRRAPHSLARIAAAGLTVRLHDPSPAYLRWLEAALREDAT